MLHDLGLAGRMRSFRNEGAQYEGVCGVVINELDFSSLIEQEWNDV